MNNENNKTVTLELSNTEAIVLCGALTYFCDDLNGKMQKLGKSKGFRRRSYQTNTPDFFQMLRHLGEMKVGSELLLTLIAVLPPLGVTEQSTLESMRKTAIQNSETAEVALKELEEAGIEIKSIY